MLPPETATLDGRMETLQTVVRNMERWTSETKRVLEQHAQIPAPVRARALATSVEASAMHTDHALRGGQVDQSVVAKLQKKIHDLNMIISVMDEEMDDLRIDNKELRDEVEELTSLIADDGDVHYAPPPDKHGKKKKSRTHLNAVNTRGLAKKRGTEGEPRPMNHPGMLNFLLSSAHRSSVQLGNRWGFGQTSLKTKEYPLSICNRV